MEESYFNINNNAKAFIKQNIDTDSYLLALNLKAKKNMQFDVKFALEQINLRRRIKEKLPQWYSNFDLVLPSAISAEQCSSEAAAKYKSNLCKGKNFVDLTGGLGVDFAFISQNFENSIYVEADRNLSETAKHNFGVLKLQNVRIENCDSRVFIENINRVDCIYIDPARRNAHSKKEILLENCSPDIMEIKDMLMQKSNMVVIKLSPLFEIAEVLKKLDSIKQIHVVAVKNECKELLVLLDKNYNKNNIEVICANIFDNKTQLFSFNMNAEKQLDCEFVQDIQAFLYEPNAAIQKSGGFRTLAKQFNLKMLHINSRIYTSNSFVADFCGRIFTVESVFGFNKGEIGKHLHNIKQANITVRNFPLSVANLRKKLNISEGGDTYLFATTLFDGRKVIVKCRKGI